MKCDILKTTTNTVLQSICNGMSITRLESLRVEERNIIEEIKVLQERLERVRSEIAVHETREQKES